MLWIIQKPSLRVLALRGAGEFIHRLRLLSGFFLEDTKMATLKAGLFPVVICRICGESLPSTDENFYWNKRDKYFETRCLECKRKYNNEWNRKHRENNREKAKEYHEKNKEAIKEYNNSYASFTTYAERLTVDENPIDDGNGYMLVLCTYCGKYFHPTINAVKNRIAALLGQVEGECRLYCSDGCKDACPVFHQNKWPKGFKPATSREVDPLIRQMCLAKDNYTCQECGATTEEAELHCHHWIGATAFPAFANDVDYTTTFCKECHIWIHSMIDGCLYDEMKCATIRTKYEEKRKKAEEATLSTPIRLLKCNEDQQQGLFPQDKINEWCKIKCS